MTHAENFSGGRVFGEPTAPASIHAINRILDRCNIIKTSEVLDLALAVHQQWGETPDNFVLHDRASDASHAILVQAGRVEIYDKFMARLDESRIMRDGLFRFNYPYDKADEVVQNARLAAHDVILGMMIDDLCAPLTEMAQIVDSLVEPWNSMMGPIWRVNRQGGTEELPVVSEAPPQVVEEDTVDQDRIRKLEIKIDDMETKIAELDNRLTILARTTGEYGSSTKAVEFTNVPFDSIWKSHSNSTKADDEETLS